MALLGGRDCFTPNAGKWESKICPTCGRPMSVKRNCKGPRGSVANMAVRHRRSMAEAAGVEPPKEEHEPYDFFQCIFAGNVSHKQARDLMVLASNTPSPTLEGIYLDDAKKILQTTNFSYNADQLKKADDWMKEEFGDRV